MQGSVAQEPDPEINISGSKLRLSSKIQGLISGMISDCFEITFLRVVIAFLFTGSIIGGYFVSLFSPGIDYMDGVFLAASGITGTGLSTNEMKDLSPISLATIFILMLLGSTIMLLLPPMLYRRANFRKVRPMLIKYLEQEGSSDRHAVNVLRSTLENGDLVYRAIGMVALIIGLYLFFWIVLGTGIMYAIALQYDEPAEMQSRNFGRLSTNAFLVVSSFCNCGYTLTSDSLMSYGNMAGICTWCCVIILAGNTAAPILLWGLASLLHRCAGALGLDREALRFALDNPRLITTHLFDKFQTALLLLMLVAINGAEYVLFLASSMSAEEVKVMCPILDSTSSKIVIVSTLSCTPNAQVWGLYPLSEVGVSLKDGFQAERRSNHCPAVKPLFDDRDAGAPVSAARRRTGARRGWRGWGCCRPSRRATRASASSTSPTWTRREPRPHTRTSSPSPPSGRLDRRRGGGIRTRFHLFAN
jgi:hypothetical protein